MLCSLENSPRRVGTRQSRSAMDQSLGWRRSRSHESHTPNRAHTGKDSPIRRHKPISLGPLALSCSSRAAQHLRCFALATSAQLPHQTNWLPGSSAGYDAGSSCFPGHRLCTPQARARIDGRGATGGTARRHRPSGQIGSLVQTLQTCGIRPCLPATIPSSSSSMHHERMAHILSPEVLPHPRSSLTRATFSRRFGVCSLCPRKGACLKSFTLCSDWVCVWQRPSLECCVNHAELSGALFCSTPAWPAWPSNCCRRRCVLAALAMRWGQEDLDQPDLPQRFPKVGTRATAGCASRLLLLWSQDDVERVSVNAEKWDCQLGRLPTTRS